MKKRAALLLLLALLLTACGRAAEPASTPAPTVSATVSTPAPTPASTPTPEPTPEPEGLHFTRDTMPRLDGSTATVPLARAVCAAMLGEDEDAVSDLVQFSKTTTSYYNLMDGRADLLIVYEGSEEVYAEKERRGYRWEKTAFANDAFVFVVNEDNPVDSITIDEARDIYAGRITNWAELGGEDRAITAFQRNPGAGSQTLMEKLVMQGEPMMEAPTDYVIGEMSALIQAVKSYDGSPGAIGYTVYYYAEEMKMAKGLKLLALEGVAPTPETIRGETYPLINPNYLVLPADAAEDAPNRLLYNWLLSEEGQRLVAETGYVSVMALDVTPRAVPLVGTRLYEGFTDTLLPRDDYGLLIPYAGQRLTDTGWALDGCLWGLMTAEGAVVTDPVYSSARRPAYYEDGERVALPLLLLRQGETLPDGSARSLLRVAAADGSWCTEETYLYAVTFTEDGGGLLLFDEESMSVMAADGTITERLRYGEMGLTEEQRLRVMENLQWGEASRLKQMVRLDWLENNRVLCYDLAEHRLVTLSVAEIEVLYDPYTPINRSYAVEGAEPVWDELLGREGDYLLRAYLGPIMNRAASYYRSDGTPFPELDAHVQNGHGLSLKGGLIEILEEDTAGYYDLETLSCVFRTRLNYEDE